MSAHVCSKCGDEARLSYNQKMIDQLVSRQLCFSCNFYWRYLHDSAKEEGWHHHSTGIVIDGKIYTDCGNQANPDPRGYGVGHGGAKFRIRMLDGSREWVTNNLWHGGEVPEVWRSEIPNTAEFLPLSAMGKEAGK